MNWYSIEKEFIDYAEDIEAVNIHYAWTPSGGVPDWEQQRITRYMPFAQVAAVAYSPSTLPADGENVSSPSKRRRKILKLPLHLTDPESGLLVDHYLLHYYFEIYQSGYRHYTPLYTEEVATGVETQSVGRERLASVPPSDTITNMVGVTG